MTYWNPTNEARLTEMVDAGKSALQIATQLGGISRNAIIGKCARMGLSLHGAQNTSAATSAAAAANRLRHARARVERGLNPQAPKPRVVKAVPTPAVVPITRRLTLENLGTHDCKWPGAAQEEGQWTFCGVPATHQSYCAYHARLAYTPRER